MMYLSSITNNAKYASFIKQTKSKKFAKIYLYLSLVTLFTSTLFWSMLGANIHQSNADQIVNSQLFESFDTFNGAMLPGAHSFLLKWPLFVLVSLLGTNSHVLIGITAVTVLSTIAILTYILYVIDRRPLMFGTLSLALASVLMMIPAQPYGAALLPVNMAMLATRNLEYVLYLVCLIGLIKYRSIYSKGFWFSALGLGILFASDKLFLMFSIVGAVIGLLVYAKNHQWRMTSLSIDWLVLSFISAVLASLCLLLINNLNITNIVGQSTSSPYSVVTSVHDLILGLLYGVSSILTNFGANPAYDALTIRSIPQQIYRHFISLSGFSYLVNLTILGVGVYASYELVKNSLNHRKAASLLKRHEVQLTIMLVATSIAAFMSYIMTVHYYPADARYLTIFLFAVFIGLAAHLSRQKYKSDKIVLIGALLGFSIFLGATSQINAFQDSMNALKPVSARSSNIAQILSNKRVNVLVGDYWRVVPAKLSSNNKLNIMPLGSCTELRQVLSSKSWQKNLNSNSFAYLLTLDGGNLTDYPNCTLQDVIKAYGNPNSTVLVDGTLKNPKEYLLFYDKGINIKKNVINTPIQQLTAPISLDELPNTGCLAPSSLNIVAHQDDDLLFMNPDILTSVKAGHCTRTVFVTAGDSGSGKYYYLSRQKGAEAAYNAMTGSKDVWIERTVKLPNHQYIIVASPKNNKKISLIFLNLPDGNLRGEGFESSDYASLSKLRSGSLDTIYSLDGQSSYKQSQLIDTLVFIMQAYQPSLIRTQAADVGYNFHDHSDHSSVGNYAKQAYKQFIKTQYSDQVAIPIAYYIGYPTHEFEPNVVDQDLTEKEHAFLEYAKYDGGVCSTIEQCRETFTYGSYLTRQYQNNE